MFRYHLSKNNRYLNQECILVGLQHEITYGNSAYFVACSTCAFHTLYIDLIQVHFAHDVFNTNVDVSCPMN